MRSLDNHVDVLERLITSYRDVFEHLESVFQYEEEFIFPLVLSGCTTPDCMKLIWELKEEHTLILKGLKEFLKISPQNAIEGGEELTLRLEKLGRLIVDILSDHTEKEDDKVLPLLRKHVADS